MPKTSKKEKPPLRILFIAAEADPLIKVGGLGDVAGSLPRALRALTPDETGGRSLDIRLVIPFHHDFLHKIENPQPVASFVVQGAQKPIPAQAFLHDLAGVPTYLISGSPIPPDAPVYSKDIREDGHKYFFFCQAVIELARSLNWQPDIIHANDWHTACVVYALSLKRQEDDFYAHCKSVLTIHNLPFMGAGSEGIMDQYGLPPSNDERLPAWARRLPLPLGLLHADQIVAVSPTYAQEIMTPEHGCDLQDFLQLRKDNIRGILNGLDTQEWRPSTDAALPARYDAAQLTQRLENKRALLSEFSLKPDIELPLLIFIGRMDQQKGVDLALGGLEQLANLPWQAIFLGSGDPKLEDACRLLEANMPDRVRAAIRFDASLSRRMYAGGDILLMPSRYEPCGLAQMIAMRYGCVPLGRATGGLKDTIHEEPELRKSTGFLFNEPSEYALAYALHRAITIYQERKTWQHIQKNGMAQDFSWQRSALAYAHIYLQLNDNKQ